MALCRTSGIPPILAFSRSARRFRRLHVTYYESSSPFGTLGRMQCFREYTRSITVGVVGFRFDFPGGFLLACSTFSLHGCFALFEFLGSLLLCFASLSDRLLGLGRV
jgi:hypothetical protein